MKMIKLFATATVLAASTSAADAAVVVNIAQNGTSVVATTTGSLNLAGLTAVPNYSLSRGLYPLSAYVGTGSVDGASVTGYTGFTGPTSIGTSTAYTSATTGTGASFAINGSGFGVPYVFVDPNYASGSSLAGTSTFVNATLASLGLTTGSYVFRSANDTVTINVGAAVPELGTWAMMILGMGAVGFAMRRGRKTKVATQVRFA